jgi:hypothetical protein
MPDGFLGIVGHQSLQLGLGLLVLEIGRTGSGKDPGKLRPRIGRAHVKDTKRIDPGWRWVNAKQARELSTLDTAPELPLRRDNQMLIERIRGGGDLNPLATTGNNGEHRRPGSDHPHIVLQLRSVLGQRCLFRELPGQHEL